MPAKTATVHLYVQQDTDHRQIIIIIHYLVFLGITEKLLTKMHMP